MKKKTKTKKRRVVREPTPIARVLYTAQCLPLEDPLRARVVARIKLELAETGGDMAALAEAWNVTKRQVHRTLKPYRESGELVDKLTVGQKIKKALAAHRAEAGT